MDFSAKVVLITGGSSGIGLALARRLAGLGASVWCIARGQERLEAAMQKVRAAQRGPEQICGAISTDVTDADQVAEAVAQVTDAAGLPDLLVNCAGVAHPGTVQDLDLKIFHWMMDVNYFGTVYATKAVLPGMIRRGSGHIANISSTSGYIGAFGYTAYGAAKFAVKGFSDALRQEVKPLGIQVSIVYLPDVDTPQLAYENRFKPPETRVLAEINGAPMTPEAAAEAILKGIARRQYVILPNLECKIINLAAGLVGNGVYPIMDWLVAWARRKATHTGKTEPGKHELEK